MSRSRVQVLTLAEIAFTLLFAVIILSLPQISEARKNREERDKLADELARVRHELEDARRQIKLLEERLPNRLSNIPPPCAGNPLERLTVLTASEFLVGGVSLDARAIASKHTEALQQAEATKCRHRAVVTWRDTLPASALDSALKQLERYFYIQRAGSVDIP